jgi:riboflavin biosynthesis pyrimidine reductase
MVGLMVNQKFKEFKKTPIQISDLETFYNIANSSVTRDRPYSWYVFVMTADGIGSFLDGSYPDYMIGLGGSGIALKQFLGKRSEAKGAIADAYILQYGRAVADAVLIGSNVLRAEPNLIMAPWDKKLIAYRAKLGKAKPINIVVTGKGFSSKEMEKYPLFKSKDVKTIIATSQKGYKFMMGQLAMLKNKDKITAQFKVFGKKTVNFKILFSALRKKPYSIRFLEISGGPDIAGQIIRQGLLDEYRITISPGIAGFMDSKGTNRPGPVNENFKPADMPTMSLDKIGNYGSHVFLRYKMVKNHQK